MLQKLVNGAREDVISPKRYDTNSSAWVECNSIKRYDTDSAAWVDAWTNAWAETDSTVLYGVSGDNVSTTADLMMYYHVIGAAYTGLWFRIAFPEAVMNPEVMFDFTVSGEQWYTNPNYYTSDQMDDIYLAPSRYSVEADMKAFVFDPAVSASTQVWEGTASARLSGTLSEVWVYIVGGASSVCQGYGATFIMENLLVNGNKIKFEAFAQSV